MQNAVPKLWIFFFVIVLVLVMAILTSSSQTPVSESLESSTPETTRYTTYENMLERGDNAIYVENQNSHSTFVLVGFAVLSKPGFIVIYDDNSGVPGSIVGESMLLPTGGEHLIVPVETPLLQDQVYYAMLYHDSGDGRFRIDDDTQVVDSEQSVVLMTFLAINQAAPETGPVVP